MFKSRKGELKASVFDLLKQNRSIIRNVTDSYVQDVRNEVLTQYFMLTFTYNLRNFGMVFQPIIITATGLQIIKGFKRDVSCYRKRELIIPFYFVVCMFLLLET